MAVLISSTHQFRFCLQFRYFAYTELAAPAAGTYVRYGWHSEIVSRYGVRSFYRVVHSSDAAAGRRPAAQRRRATSARVEHPPRHGGRLCRMRRLRRWRVGPAPGTAASAAHVEPSDRHAPGRAGPGGAPAYSGARPPSPVYRVRDATDAQTDQSTGHTSRRLSELTASSPPAARAHVARKTKTSPVARCRAVCYGLNQ